MSPLIPTTSLSLSHLLDKNLQIFHTKGTQKNGNFLLSCSFCVPSEPIKEHYDDGEWKWIWKTAAKVIATLYVFSFHFIFSIFFFAAHQRRLNISMQGMVKFKVTISLKSWKWQKYSSRDSLFWKCLKISWK